MLLKSIKTVEELAAAIKSLDVVTAVPWTDYSATSTIVGWSSTTTEEIWYKKIGKLVFVQFFIDGTSDSTSTTFTLPYSQQSDFGFAVAYRAEDNGTYGVGNFALSTGSSTVILRADMTTGAATWTASGAKSVIGQFWYQTA